MRQARSLLWALVLSLLVHTGAVLGLRGLGFGPRPLPPLFVELVTPVVAQSAIGHGQPPDPSSPSGSTRPRRPPAPSRVEPLPGRASPAPGPTPLPVTPALPPPASPPDRLIASAPPDLMAAPPPPPPEHELAPSRPSPSPAPRPTPSPVTPREGGRDRPRPLAALSVPPRVGLPDSGSVPAGGLGGARPASPAIGSSATPGQRPADPGTGRALVHFADPTKGASRGGLGSEGTHDGEGRGGPSPLAALSRGPEETGGAPPEYRAYLEAFRRKVQESLVYPAPALRRQLQGTVRLEVRLLDTGEVARVVVLRSSGHVALDEAAVRTVEDAGPFPFPTGIPSRPLTIHLPVVFELR